MLGKSYTFLFHGTRNNPLLKALPLPARFQTGTGRCLLKFLSDSRWPSHQAPNITNESPKHCLPLTVRAREDKARGNGGSRQNPQTSNTSGQARAPGTPSGPSERQHPQPAAHRRTALQGRSLSSLFTLLLSRWEIGGPGLQWLTQFHIPNGWC